MVGKSLGAYEVLAKLGEGGMGQVYRARDTKLGRDVAIKVLPPEFVSDPERVARFQREAQVLAALNHPHIAQIYGFEETAVGPAEAGHHVESAFRRTFLVMELVDGETLDQRIARGPIPVDEALPIATQIAEALEAAHEKGIIHRDLKPSNIAVTHEGQVKVLDFGLAKLAEVSPAKAGPYDLSASPTITSPALMTGIGMLLGTAAYMSPEQARGREADKRSDVWAFGCVLFEMLAGRHAFGGDDVADTLANVLKVEPPWDALPADVPQAIRVLLRRTLSKHRDQRCRDLSAALLVLEEHDSLVSRSTNASPAPPSRRRAWLVAAALLLIAGGGAAAYRWLPTSTPAPMVRSFVSTTFGLAAGNERALRLTADGKAVVYVAANARRVLMRRLDELDAHPIGEFLAARTVLPSPDGAWIGVIDGDTIVKVPVGGGTSLPVARVGGSTRGATWVDANRIVVATSNPSVGLQMVSPAGGEPVTLTRPDTDRGEADHLWPEAIPGTNAVLFTIARSDRANAFDVALLDLESRHYRVIVSGGSDARYASGYVIYITSVAADAGTVTAVRFDPKTLSVRGQPVPVVRDVARYASGVGEFDVASTGSLVYQPFSAAGRRLVRVDAAGNEEEIASDPRGYRSPRVSPDGTRILFDDTFNEQDYDLWTLDIARRTVDRITSYRGRESDGIWSPDGKMIAYLGTDEQGDRGLFIRPADGTGRPERLTTQTDLPMYWSPRGWIAYLDFPEGALAGNAANTLERIDLATRKASRILSSNGTTSTRGRIDPTEKWIAVVDAVDGRNELYVRPFPNIEGGRWRISTGGGTDAVWARDGRKLFYRQDQAVYEVDVIGPEPSKWPAPRRLFEGPYLFQTGPSNIDVGPDGRFVLLKNSAAQDSSPALVVLVQNWFEELQRMVPAR